VGQECGDGASVSSRASLVGFGAGDILVIFQTCAPPQEVRTWTGMGNFTADIGGVLAPLVTGILTG
jgi:hypothetical protein